ncbi:MAG: serine/threonine protein kinase, partial [Pseudoxanthomonas sp.]
MELDELKATWQALDRKLAQGNAIQLQLFKDGRLKNMRAGLRPLFWGQIVQILFGALTILTGISFWSQHRDVVHLFYVGLILHIYGVVTIIAAGVTLGRIRGIDYSAPVLGIQKQLASVRSAYVGSGLIVGHAWWLLWIPFAVVVFEFVGVDIYTVAPGFVFTSVAIGLAGLLAMGVFHYWASSARGGKLG